MIFRINDSSSINLTSKRTVDLYIIPTYTSNDAADHANDRFENNLGRMSAPCTSKVATKKISLNKMATNPYSVRTNLNRNRYEVKGNAIKTLLFVSLVYCLTWLPFFILFTIEVIIEF
ncbi:unnamed protein product [Gordionus sp. m RMFG-2023]